MSRKTRILLGLLILAISLSLLLWGFLPSPRESHSVPISPSDLQLPTPSSLRFGTPGEFHVSLLSASLAQPEIVS